MNFFSKYIGSLFLTTRLYVSVGVCAALFVVSFYYPPLFIIPKILFYIIVFLVIVDYFFLFFGKAPSAKRIMADRFSNGDENKVTLEITNNMAFPVQMEIID